MLDTGGSLLIMVKMGKILSDVAGGRMACDVRWCGVCRRGGVRGEVDEERRKTKGGGEGDKDRRQMIYIYLI